MIVNILNHRNTHKKLLPIFGQITTTAYLKANKFFLYYYYLLLYAVDINGDHLKNV